jgi:hypothetical protein
MGGFLSFTTGIAIYPHDVDIKQSSRLPIQLQTRCNGLLDITLPGLYFATSEYNEGTSDLGKIFFAQVTHKNESVQKIRLFPESSKITFDSMKQIYYIHTENSTYLHTPNDIDLLVGFEPEIELELYKRVNIVRL